MARTLDRRSIPGFLIRSAPIWRTLIYAAATKRDLRLDLLRGFCLFAMIVDHIAGPSVLHRITGGNRFYVSAAEGFVFISGLLLGMISRTTIARDGFGAVLTKTLRRAANLYLLMVALTLGFNVCAWLLGLPWADPQHLGGPGTFLWSVLALQRAYWLTDILVLYTLLVAAAPLALWLLRRHQTTWLLAGSWLLWLAYQCYPEVLARPLPATRAFNPAAWQIYFVHALALGYHRERASQLLSPRVRRLLLVASIGLLGSLLWLYHAEGAVLGWLFGGDASAWVQALTAKGEVRPGRLVAAAVVFPFAYLLATYLWRPLHTALGWLLLPLGQRSLYGYTLHLPLILLTLRLAPGLAGVPVAQPALNAGLQLGSVLLIWMVLQWRFRSQTVRGIGSILRAGQGVNWPVRSSRWLKLPSLAAVSPRRRHADCQLRHCVSGCGGS